MPAVSSSGAFFEGGMYSPVVERYCGGYDGADCQNESARVAAASTTITDDAEDDVEAFSSSLSVLSSSHAEPCDVIKLPEAGDAIELNISDPRLQCGALTTSLDIWVINQRETLSHRWPQRTANGLTS
jgi:hypothetical protein